MTILTDDELLKQRAVRLTGPIDDAVARGAISRLLFLQYQDRAAPIKLLVDSPGGSITACMAILDTMDHLMPPVHTCCTGLGAGTALVVLAHGARGHRTCWADSQFVFAPVWSTSGSEVSEDQLEDARRELAAVLARDTGRSEAEVRAELNGCRWLSAAEAHAWGIVD
jgi:ATP-dependent Clp protease protease subunit